jgi:hypothetical protein
MKPSDDFAAQTIDSVVRTAAGWTFCAVAWDDELEALVARHT